VFFCLFLPGLPVIASSVPPETAPVVILEATLDAAISPAQADMLDAALAKARSIRAAALLLRLDTPGGGIEPMRRMVISILNAPVPVVVYVAPSGARAASAGVFLMAAAQVAAMAPQTTIGSASPVGPGGGDLTGTLDAKIKNDLESMLRGVAAARGRNVDWYTGSVRSAANCTAAEAVRDRVVDCIAVDRDDLFTQIGKRGLPVGGQLLHFSLKDVSFAPYEPGLWYSVLSWLIDPQIAYILLLAGMAGLYFELTTPGAVLPGVIGGISLLLSLYALSILPTNVAGLLLLLLGVAFFGLELHIASYGLLSIAGAISLCIGSLLLFRFQGRSALPVLFILPTVVGLSILLGLGTWIMAKSQRKKPQGGLTSLIGQTAHVRQWQGKTGKVFVHGELWNAETPEPCALATGQEVVITQARDMLLLVAAKSGTSGETL
jgi:membrane-bound serine protease (ClpP class)